MQMGCASVPGIPASTLEAEQDCYSLCELRDPSRTWVQYQALTPLTPNQRESKPPSWLHGHSMCIQTCRQNTSTTLPQPPHYFLFTFLLRLFAAKLRTKGIWCQVSYGDKGHSFRDHGQLPYKVWHHGHLALTFDKALTQIKRLLVLPSVCPTPSYMPPNTQILTLSEKQKTSLKEFRKLQSFTLQVSLHLIFITSGGTHPTISLPLNSQKTLPLILRQDFVSFSCVALAGLKPRDLSLPPEGWD